MVQKSSYINHRLDGARTCCKQWDIHYQPQLVTAGFLNDQQYQYPKQGVISLILFWPLGDSGWLDYCQGWYSRRVGMVRWCISTSFLRFCRYSIDVTSFLYYECKHFKNFKEHLYSAHRHGRGNTIIAMNLQRNKRLVTHTSYGLRYFPWKGEVFFLERFGMFGYMVRFPIFCVTPWKINMEPENHLFEKENHLPNLNFWVPC